MRHSISTLIVCWISRKCLYNYLVPVPNRIHAWELDTAHPILSVWWCYMARIRAGYTTIDILCSRTICASTSWIARVITYLVVVFQTELAVFCSPYVVLIIMLAIGDWHQIVHWKILNRFDHLVATYTQIAMEIRPHLKSAFARTLIIFQVHIVLVLII